MEDKNIIIILIVIIIALAVIMGAMFFTKSDAKKATELQITSNDTINVGDNLTVQLDDADNIALSKQKITIEVKDKNGKAVLNKTVKTNSKGKASLDLNLNKGEYDVSVAYAGNGNFTKSAATQKLNVGEVKTQTVSSSSASSSTPYDINNLPPTNDPYPETARYFLDEYHVKQEYADGYMRSVDIRTGEIHSIGFK